MTIERTFSIVKPDAVKRNLIGAIYRRIEKKQVCKSLLLKCFV